MSLCPECGEELDDFSPCACLAVGPAELRPVPARRIDRMKHEMAAGGMRAMVARKLARKAARPT